jgi:pyridoxine 5-phosphate synthase
MRLGVNIDHVATVRNARGERYPNPVHAAMEAEVAGADNITCHLREDRRHIKDEDVILLRKMINIPLNLEIGATDEMIDFAVKVKPDFVTLVPEKREELTTEGGLNVAAMKDSLKVKVAKLKEHGIHVALFVEPDKEIVDLSLEIGAAALEIHTGRICHDLEKAHKTKEKWEAMASLISVAETTRTTPLQLHVGHGLNYTNAHWLQIVPQIEEANIGHAIVARALFVGMREAVREMKDLLNNPDRHPRISQ